MRTGTGRTKYGHKREGNTGHGEHRSEITPPLPLLNGVSRTVHHPTGRGGVGALEASRNTETGQEASRAAPVPRSTAEWGARAATADQGIQNAMAGPLINFLD